MKATLDNRGHVSRIWSDELDRSLAIAHNTFYTATRTPVSVAPLQYREEDLASCQMLAIFGIYRAQTVVEVLRNFREAYSRAEKKFGDKHLMSYHNHVYHRKSTALFVCISIS